MHACDWVASRNSEFLSAICAFDSRIAATVYPSSAVAQKHPRDDDCEQIDEESQPVVLVQGGIRQEDVDRED